MNTDTMAGYAKAKVVPGARPSVAVTGGMLVVGGLSVLTGTYVIGASTLAIVLLVTTPPMHGVWTQEGQATQEEMS